MYISYIYIFITCFIQIHVNKVSDSNDTSDGRKELGIFLNFKKVSW